VKHGVYEAGGFPVEFPVFSTGESSLRPTAMMFRNLASMDVEEALRANPIDGVVLLGGCDKTTPALLMGLRAPTCRRSSFPADPCSTAGSAASASALAPRCGRCRRTSRPAG
jgi:dihydroxyacid dehydratase/phosphogluconate dehydratase